MCFDDALDGFDAYLKANRGLSANTRRAYRSDVEECLVALRKQGCVDLNEVTIEDLRLWMAESSKNHARSSMARKTVAVRGFFAWAYDHDMASANPAASLQTPKIPDTLPAVLNETQAQQHGESDRQRRQAACHAVRRTSRQGLARLAGTWPSRTMR